MTKKIGAIVLSRIDSSRLPGKALKKVKNKGTLIKFEDDGPGIPENKRDDVLKAFYRIDETRLSRSGNTGLGLTITKNFNNNHG